MRVLLCLSLLCACGPAPGRLSLTASGGDAVENGFSTADGYTVRFTKAALVVGEFAFATSADQQGPQTGGVLTVDLLEPAPRIVRTFSGVPAQRWDAMRWSLGNDGGMSLELEGTLNQDNTSKTFAWAFNTDTLYGPCVEGVTIPSNGTTQAELTVDATRLWSDSTDAGTLRADAMFTADTGDDVISLEELSTVAAPGGTGTLRDFVTAQVRTIGGFNGAPCTITAR